MNLPRPSVAVIIPCFNEALAIGQVLGECRAALPDATLYVFDNNSSDGTAAIAVAAGATVIPVRRQSKGNVVRRMFADIDADVYVMVDGDATYDMSAAQRHVDLLLRERLDMVVGRRVDDLRDARTYSRPMR